MLPSYDARADQKKLSCSAPAVGCATLQAGPMTATNRVAASAYRALLAQVRVIQKNTCEGTLTLRLPVDAEAWGQGAPRAGVEHHRHAVRRYLGDLVQTPQPAYLAGITEPVRRCFMGLSLTTLLKMEICDRTGQTTFPLQCRRAMLGCASQRQRSQPLSGSALNCTRSAKQSWDPLLLSSICSRCSCWADTPRLPA